MKKKNKFPQMVGIFLGWGVLILGSMLMIALILLGAKGILWLLENF